MADFGTLYRFELKKLLQRKMVWAALAILTAAVILPPASSVIGKMYISSEVTGQEVQVYTHYELVQRRRQDPAGLEGRKLDTDLIREAIGAMDVIRRTDEADGGDTAFVTVRQTDPDAMGWTLDGYTIQGEYWDIWDTVESMVGQEDMTDSLTGEAYYAAVDADRAAGYDGWGLTEGERAWWAAQAEKIERPLTVTGYPNGGWTAMAETAYVANLFIFLFAIIALSGLFPMERQRRTDALAACARNGGTPLYAAKLLAGLTVSFAGGAVILGAMAAACLILLGPEDAATAVQQFIAPAWGAPMTVMQLALILCGAYLAASLIHAVFVMAVSLLTRGGTAAMAVCFGTMMLFIMVYSLPRDWRAASQLWSLLPGVFGNNSIVFDDRLVHIGGYLTCWQAAPLLWLAMALALAGLGLALHRRTAKK